MIGNTVQTGKRTFQSDRQQAVGNSGRYTGHETPQPCRRLRTRHEVRRLLEAIDQGDPQAADRLLPAVDDELRRLVASKLAAQPKGQIEGKP